MNTPIEMTRQLAVEETIDLVDTEHSIPTPGISPFPQISGKEQQPPSTTNPLAYTMAMDTHATGLPIGITLEGKRLLGVGNVRVSPLTRCTGTDPLAGRFKVRIS